MRRKLINYGLVDQAHDPSLMLALLPPSVVWINMDPVGS